MSVATPEPSMPSRLSRRPAVSMIRAPPPARASSASRAAPEGPLPEEDACHPPHPGILYYERKSIERNPMSSGVHDDDESAGGARDGRVLRHRQGGSDRA